MSRRGWQPWRAAGEWWGWHAAGWEAEAAGDWRAAGWVERQAWQAAGWVDRQQAEAQPEVHPPQPQPEEAEEEEEQLNWIEQAQREQLGRRPTWPRNVGGYSMKQGGHAAVPLSSAHKIVVGT